MRRANILLLTLVSLQLMGTAAFARIDFVATAPFSVSRKPDILAAGDFNRDGLADVVVVASASDEVDVVISAPGGGFLRGTVEALFTTRIEGVAVADLNQDTLDDIVLADQRGRGEGRIWILLGRGSGAFQDPYYHTASNSPFSPILVDFDIDGDLDIAYTDKTQQQLYILVSDGGNPPLFAPGGTILLAKKPEGVAGGRFDRDADTDLMALNTGGPRGKDVTFVRNDGVNAGTGFPVFRDAGQFMVGEKAWAITGSDPDGNGITDLAMLNNPTRKFSTSQLQVLFSSGGGLFDGPISVDLPCPNLEVGFYCRAATDKQNLGTGDFDADGLMDFVTTEEERDWTNNIRRRVFMRFVRAAAPGRRFALKSAYDVDASPYALVVADFGGDEKPDVVVGTRSNSKLTMFLNVSTTPAEPGLPCNDDEDCESEECIDGICCEDICPPGYTCAVPGHLGECYRLRDDGEDCNFDIECLSGFCTDGVCCESDQCPPGERCDIYLYEGQCHDLLPYGAPCGENSDCLGGWCTDGICCRVEICPPGDVCVPPDGFCESAPTPTQTPQPPGYYCEEDSDCQPGLYCVNNVCCTEPFCPNGYYCESEGEWAGTCVPGTPRPTRTPTPTRIPSVPPTPPTPVCTPPFRWNGQFCATVSRGGGCAIDPGKTPSAGAAAVFVLLPAALWFARRKRRGE